MSARPLMIGIGNPDRGDDAAGRLVAQGLRAKIGDVVDIAEARGEAMEIAALLEGRAICVVADACMSGAVVGRFVRLDMRDVPAPRRSAEVSSHGQGLAEALELARALGTLPERCIVYAIEAASFERGAAPAPAVVRAAGEVVTAIAAELFAITADRAHCPRQSGIGRGGGGG